jgi:hypothetical protein
MIILIFIDSTAVQMFFPNTIDAFFISEDEFASLTFREVDNSRGLNIDFFEKILENKIGIDLSMIEF